MTEQTKEQTDYEKLQDIGRNAMNCIAEMVAALNCDYDRLEELMDERKALQEAFDDAETNEDPDDHATGVARADAELELKEWDAEHAEELAELIEAAGESESRQDAEQRIQEDPLSLEFRSDWELPGVELKPAEFKLLLSTGGPATQIIGELNEHGEPDRARLQAQD